MAQLGTVVIGTMNVLMTVISMLIVDLAGRKTLLSIGFGAMFIDTVILCASFTIAVSALSKYWNTLFMPSLSLIRGCLCFDVLIMYNNSSQYNEPFIKFFYVVIITQCGIFMKHLQD